MGRVVWFVVYHAQVRRVLCSEFNAQQLGGPPSPVGTRKNFARNTAAAYRPQNKTEGHNLTVKLRMHYKSLQHSITLRGLILSEMLAQVYFFKARSHNFEKRLLASVCLSVPMEKIGLALGRFSWSFIFEYFSKFIRENSSFNKIRQG